MPEGLTGRAIETSPLRLTSLIERRSRWGIRPVGTAQYSRTDWIWQAPARTMDHSPGRPAAATAPKHGWKTRDRTRPPSERPRCALPRPRPATERACSLGQLRSDATEFDVHRCVSYPRSAYQRNTLPSSARMIRARASASAAKMFPYSVAGRWSPRRRDAANGLLGPRARALRGRRAILGCR